MNIAIDGNEANEEKRVGIGAYAYQLLLHLYGAYSKHKFIIFLKKQPVRDLPSSTELWQYRVIGPKHFWTQLALPLKLYTTKGLDLIFSPTHYAPRFSPVPSIISIMDLSFLKYPQLFKKSDLLKLTKWTAYSVRQAKRIITISNFSRESIITTYRVNPNKIFVTYPGYNKNIFHQNYTKNEIDKIKNKYQLTNFLLFVGTIQPRKNILRLIQAFNKLQQSFPEYKLVIVGKKGWLFEEIFNEINNKIYRDRIVYLGYLDDSTIAKLYNSSACLILPSFYEGFGLPIIEAMACGCPVVLSNTSSLPEVAKDASVYINPFSVDSIAEGIVKVIRSDQNYFREKLISRGLIRVKDFSWEKCALQTLNIFESI